MDAIQPTLPVETRIDRELTHPQVIALLEEHLAGMRAESPPECVFALDLNALRQHNITFITVWRTRTRHAASDASQATNEVEDELIACGVIIELDAQHGELKSMRTATRHLRQGAAQAILTELLNIARQRGYARVSLETGSTPGFDAAIAMYRRFGFVECGPFGGYRADPFSRFMTMDLTTPQLTALRGSQPLSQ